MDLDTFITLFGQFGPLGLVAAVMIWHNIKTTSKLVQIIESNTAALTRMQDVIDRLCDKIET